MTELTEFQAKELAKLDDGYRARKLHGRWVVWCDASDHVVEFDHARDCRCRLCSFSPLYIDR